MFLLFKICLYGVHGQLVDAKIFILFFDVVRIQAGMSLGFNLAGSLAAIDKWVQDMGSEDETEGEGNDTAASVDNSDDEQDDGLRPTGRELLFSFGAAGVSGRRVDKKEDIIGTKIVRRRRFCNCRIYPDLCCSP